MPDFNGPPRRGRGGRNFNRRGKRPNDSPDASLHHKTPAASQPFPRVSTPPLTEPVPLDTPRFADLAKENLIHPTILNTIVEDLRFDHMMPVQAATLHMLLADRADCLAQAKTGTGKTIAFLLPAIQTLIQKQRKPGSAVSLLVIAPTRELAMQIAKEANALLQRLQQFKVCIAIGGTNKDAEEKRILSGCDILIATPGRLIDHLSNENIQGLLQTLDTLVLDEADRLLDMGFMDAIKQIIGFLPNKEQSKRQGMLFSATIAAHVESVAHLVLGRNYKFISTIPKGEINTHEKVPQQLIVVPTFSDLGAAMVGSIRSELAIVGRSTLKAIIFAPTAGMADFYAAILKSISNMPEIYVLHSRLNQNKRTNTTNAFREATGGILVATDVVARGMDFPLVTNVFQVGIPADKESYIHRLGRTARAGAEGRGTFIISEPETFFSTWTLKEITFVRSEADLNAREEVRAIAEKMESHTTAYQSWLGFYKGHCKAMKFDMARLVEEANRLASDGLGSPEVPGLPKSVVSKMGLKGVPGLVIVPDPPKTSRGGGDGGGGKGRSIGSGGLGNTGPSNTGPSKGGLGGRRGGRGGRNQNSDAMA